jgi:hypothetical protein
MITHHLNQISRKEKKTEILTKKEVLKTGIIPFKEKEDLMKEVATDRILRIEVATGHILQTEMRTDLILQTGMTTDHILQKEVKVVVPGLNQPVVVPDFL